MFHSLFAQWFGLVHDWGYAGVFVLMAIESTLIPLPSEFVMPPAAYWAAEGRMSFWGVVAAGTLGSWAGASLSYGMARALGRPLIMRFGRWFLLPAKKWALAEHWIQRYGAPGVFFARLLPVVRHLVSLPAGAARMNFRIFSVMTLLGAFVWCTVLAGLGARVLAGTPGLMDDPEALAHLLRAKLWWVVVAVAALGLMYLLVLRLGHRRTLPEAAPEAAPEMPGE